MNSNIVNFALIFCLFMQNNILSSSAPVIGVSTDEVDHISVVGTTNGPPSFPWTVNVKVADSMNNVFTGGLEFDVVFSDFSQFKFMLPLQEYQAGAKYGFRIDMNSNGHVQYAVLRTIGFCSNSLPVDVLRLDWVEFRSELSRQTYFKRMNNAAVKDKCQKQRGTVLIDFEEMAAQKCEINGKTYDSGDQFDVGCTMRCHCREGQVACVDMCPPFAWMPAPNRTCEEISVQGKCCPSLMCVNDEGHKVNYIKSKTNESSVLEECRFNPLNVGINLNQGYPSVVFVCDEQCKNQSRFVTGVILNSKWIMMYGDVVPDIAETYVHVSRFGQAEENKIFKVKSAVKHATENVILLQTVDYLPDTLNVQKANLPITQNHCRRLTLNNCSIVMPQLVLDVTGKMNQLAYKRGTIESGCNSNDKREKSADLCVSLQSTCQWSKHEPMFVYDGETDYVVGLGSQSDNGSLPAQEWGLKNCCGNCVTQTRAIDVCTALDWIRQTVGNF